MDSYLSSNQDYYNKGYEAGNVESHVFRMYGRILRYEFGMDGSKGERILDFGCGQGSAAFFFKRNGFDVYGVDISEVDIGVAKNCMPDIKDHFMVIPPRPDSSDIFFGGGFDLIVSVQTLYYLDNEDMKIRLQTLNNMLKDDGFVYFTMMSKKHYTYEYAKPHTNGLSKVDFNLPRISVKDLYTQFTDSEEEMIEKFNMFEPIHVGYYDQKLRSDEGGIFHYTFFGKKKKQ